MATFQAEIIPLSVPDQVKIKVGASFVDLNVGDLDDDTISGLVIEFSERLMAAAESQRKAKK